MTLKPFRVDLIVVGASDLTLLTSYSDVIPFVPRKSDTIVAGFEKFRVLEVEITYLVPHGMNAVVYLEKI
jgi:hypothetical protein